VRTKQPANLMGVPPEKLKPPTCIFCGTKMQIRVNQRTHYAFWGCTECRHTKDVAYSVADVIGEPVGVNGLFAECAEKWR